MSTLTTDVNPASPNFHVVLPCEPQQFAEFVSALLAKPQTIAKWFDGAFDLDHSSIVDFFHLIDQRVTQQHDATLVQFKVKVLYNDGLSITHSDLGSFTSYNEVRPLSVAGTHLSWIYLIKFPTSDIATKQEIDVHIGIGGALDDIVVPRSTLMRMAFMNGGGIGFRVHHTNWTWGSDLASLLDNHITRTLTSEHWTKKWLRENGGYIGLSVFLLLVLTAFVVSAIQVRGFSYSQQALVSLRVQQNTPAVQMIAELHREIAAGLWPRYGLGIAAFIATSTIAAAFLSIWISDILAVKPPSFLNLSRQTADLRQSALRKDRRSWFIYVASLAAALGQGITSNFAYAKLVSWIVGEPVN